MAIGTQNGPEEYRIPGTRDRHSDQYGAVGVDHDRIAMKIRQFLDQVDRARTDHEDGDVETVNE